MNKKRVLLIIFSILIPFCLLLFSYKLVLAFNNYTAVQKEVINFLDNQQDLASNITSEEKSHLSDVQEVMKTVDIFFYLLLLACTLIITFCLPDRVCLNKLFLYGGLATFGLITIFLLLVFLDFGWLFSLFHQFFFPQGNWLFPANSFLIQTFPLTFFISATSKIISLTLISASFFILLYFHLKK